MICGDGWSILEAMVVCRMLGFGYASSAVQTNLFGGRTSSMVPIGTIHCRGNESHLGHCSVDASLQTNCLNHRNHVAGVVCTTGIFSYRNNFTVFSNISSLTVT